MQDLPSRRDVAYVDIEPILSSAKHPTCAAYDITFGEQARLARQRRRTRQARVFQFLVHVCCMRLDSSSVHAPFKPALVSANGRSALPEDFEAPQIALLEFYLNTDDPELRARVADLLWLTKKDHQGALTAIDAYVASAQRLVGTGRTNELGEATSRFDRAASLAASLNNGTKLEDVRRAIDEVFEQAQAGTLLWLPPELLIVALKHRGDTKRDYAVFARELALAEEAKNQWWQARRYWEVVAEWHHALRREAGRLDALGRAAETLAQEASTSDSAIARASLLNQALDVLRPLPRFKQRQEELKLLALEAQQQFQSEASRFEYNLEVPRNEAEQHQEQIRSFISGGTTDEALRKLASLFRSPSYGEMRTAAEDIVRAHPFRFAFSSLTLGDNNKVVARTGTKSDSDKEWEANVLHEMYQQATWHRQLHVMTTLEPARWQLIREHNPTLRDVARLIADSPVVPPDRLDLVADGILAGLRNDLVHCAHILIPQFENMLRLVLTMMGKSAFRITTDGTQEELNLNPLLTNNDDIARFLGRDILFDLRGLLVEELSVNLRNRVAHGMIRRDQIQQASTAYFWWSVLFILLGAVKK
jgi:hypothetical protein